VWLERLADDAMVKDGVPDEVDMQHRAQVSPCLFLCSPSLDPQSIEFNHLAPFGALPDNILVKQVGKVFDDLVAYLHSHALLRQGPQ